MIASIRGEVISRYAGEVVIEAAGVGYKLAVSSETLGSVPAAGEQARLLTHLVLRDDAMHLYGFSTQPERELFLMLIGVQSVGPKVALAVLSGIEPQDLIRAIERGDVSRLTAIPGVGKKTSERIVLELKDRLPKTQVVAVAAGYGDPEPPLLRDDLISALVNLGYHRPLAEKAVAAAIKTTPDGGFERTLKQALRELAR
jgi:holliday junction DNA helicase RuvA